MRVGQDGTRNPVGLIRGNGVTAARLGGRIDCAERFAIGPFDPPYHPPATGFDAPSRIGRIVPVTGRHGRQAGRERAMRVGQKGASNPMSLTRVSAAWTAVSFVRQPTNGRRLRGINPGYRSSGARPRFLLGTVAGRYT